MTMDGESPDAGATLRLKVGDWIVDPALNQLSRGSEVARLEPKAIEVLVGLARHAGQVVSRDKLLSEIWRGVTVSDDALTQSIIKLRKALGDTSKEPSYIQTIPKRGYRLIAPVTWLAPGSSPIPPAPQRPSGLPGMRKIHWIAAVACVAAALAGYGVLAPIVWPRMAAIEGLPAVGVNWSEIDNLPAVVVQPFGEIEGDQLQTLLARGFTARLITDLSRFPDIRVVSFNTATTSTAAEPPKKAAVGNYVVAGEVQRNGDDIRVFVHLTEGASGRSLWSEQYDRSYTDIFSLQDELTRQILGVLRIKVSDAELLRHARPYTRNLEAYESFLRAQSALVVRSKADNDLARQLYSRAVQLDPSFARAYAGIALTYAAERRNGWTSDGAGALAKASELAMTAQQIDPDVAEIYFVLAYVSMERGALSQAVDELRTALRLSPSYADAYALMGAIRTYSGRPDETIPLIRIAMRLVPDSGHLYFLILGRAYFFLGDSASALLYLRQAIARNPDNLEVRIFLAATLAQAGRRDDAAWEVGEIRTLDLSFGMREWLKHYPMSDARQIRQLADAMGSLGL
jgi:DNA-binding winged helix-turn-helix (wHTH) protein/TolB-like protein